MKKSKIILAFLIIISSCSKNDSNIKTDDILYFDYIPDTSIHTVIHYTPSMSPMGCENLPTPGDSNATIYLDIDNDFINDFIIQAAHSASENNYFCGSHCICFYYRISITGLNSNSFISTYLKDDLDHVPINYDILSSIQKDADWNEKAFLRLSSPGAPFSADFSEGYIGVKINNNLAWIKLMSNDKNGIVINDYAINLTEYNDILCGQKE